MSTIENIYFKIIKTVNSVIPLHVQGAAGHHGSQGGGHKKNIRKKWRTKEEERHKGLLTPRPQKAPFCVFFIFVII
jgi:hypothetical protein